MAARLVLTDREGRPRLIAEALPRQRGARELSLRVLDREGIARLISTVFIRQDGTGEVAVAVLDRHGTPRAASICFLREDGTLEVFIGFHRAGIRHVLVITTRRVTFPALPNPNAHEQQRNLAHGLAGDAAVAVLHRPRVLLAFFLREDGTLEILVGFHPAGIHRLFIIAARRPVLLGFTNPNADERQRNLSYGSAEEWWRCTLFGDDNGVFQFAGLEGHLLRAAALVLAWPRGDAIPNPAAALTIDGRLLLLGVDGARRIPQLDVAVVGPDGPLRLPPPPAAVRGVDGPPRLPPPPAAMRGVDGPTRLALLAPAAVGLDRLLLPPPPAAVRGVDGPTRLALLAPAAVGLHRLRLPPPLRQGPVRFPLLEAADDQRLRRLEEGFGRLRENRSEQLPANLRSTSNLLPRMFQLMEEMERSEYNINDDAITEASMTLMVQMLEHMSVEVRRKILSNPALSMPATNEQRNPTLANPHQKFGMWKSFLFTIGLSIASNFILYLLSVGMSLLEQSDERSNLSKCVESASIEPERENWNSWVLRFIGWLVERVVLPVVLTWFVVVIRESAIEKEKNKLRYERNGIANVLINGLSRGFFLAIRGFPGISDPNLWARLVSTIIDLLGAAFLLWIGGHWDPDIADG